MLQQLQRRDKLKEIRDSLQKAVGRTLDSTAALAHGRAARGSFMQSAEKPSLYDRLGGVYSIATVVDDFIDRIMVDPRLNANPLVPKEEE